MRYEDMNLIKDRYGYLFTDSYHMIGNEKHECIVCSRLTKSIDVLDETYICSEECQKLWDEYCNELCDIMCPYEEE